MACKYKRKCQVGSCSCIDIARKVAHTNDAKIWQKKITISRKTMIDDLLEQFSHDDDHSDDEFLKRIFSWTIFWKWNIVKNLMFETYAILLKIRYLFIYIFFGWKLKISIGKIPDVPPPPPTLSFFTLKSNLIKKYWFSKFFLRANYLFLKIF